METKHTPGPWFAKREGFSTVYIEARLRAGVIQEVAACGPTEAGQDQQEANAEFIVRACNSHDALIAALEDMMEWARAVSDEYIDGCDLRNDYRQSLSDARDALAATRGVK